MTSHYQKALPNVFPYRIEISHKDADRFVRDLLKYKAGGNGSSFAIISDTLVKNSRYLWLSQISFNYLAKRHGW